MMAESTEPPSTTSESPDVFVFGSDDPSCVDFPGFPALVWYFWGCNLACPLCHNPGAFNRGEMYKIAGQTILEQTVKNPFIDAVVFSGGEPTLQADALLWLLKNLRKERPSLHIALDSNGTHPAIIRKLVPYLDRIAIDLKGSSEDYAGLLPSGDAGFAERNIRAAEIHRNLLALIAELNSGPRPMLEIRTTLSKQDLESGRQGAAVSALSEMGFGGVYVLNQARTPQSSAVFAPPASSPDPISPARGALLAAMREIRPRLPLARLAVRTQEAGFELIT